MAAVPCTHTLNPSTAPTRDCLKLLEYMTTSASRVSSRVARASTPTPYCTHTGTTGFLVFADQDNAYPRVRWEYLFQVMRTMNIPQSFIDIVCLMYDNNELKFKINGRTDAHTCSPTNSLAQGCPLSPLLFLIVAEGLKISLDMQREFTGIRIGGKYYKLSQFADDTTLVLGDLDQLQRLPRQGPPVRHGQREPLARVGGRRAPGVHDLDPRAPQHLLRHLPIK